MNAGRAITLLASAVIMAGGVALFLVLSQNAPGAAQPSRQAPPAPLVETVTVTPTDRVPTIRQTGFLQPYREVDAAFEVAGRISMVADAFSVGNAVEAGAVLARIDTERLEAAVAQAEADLAAARARAGEAEQAFERQSELEDRGVTTEASLEEVRAALETAEAQVTVAEARLETARIDLRSATIVAPFAAYVTASTASEGQIVSVGQPVGELVHAGRARLVVGLSDRQVRALDDTTRLIGTEVDIRRAIGDGAPVQTRPVRTGTVTDVDVRLDRATRTTNLLVDVPDPFGDDPLRLDELLSVEIPFAPPEPLTAVPVAAVKEGRMVWVVGDDGALSRREVGVVLRSDDLAWLSGATTLEGARLMTTDLAGTTDGTRVRTAEDAPQRETAARAGAGE